ncbi:MarR family winged helix-turn-helix transcriptional regulator [Dactylosporangium sp. AC04546]|uniref:MarR family winged helix-turn-helix transcriptional regulator n=1 Tax=Dactylosporangium sp. AC04546 TaxID=2862460 RepID=UPI001EDEE454|nr:MarR family winged helix-turn-helix transcriptional regulator [Dactylosporangium sp. AC04546]WVK80838.1 MarR family winged helix-turn-helix transcriptional regulator [Dactylosporangium sp. AC04546]
MNTVPSPVPQAVETDMYQQPGHLIRRAQQVHNWLWTTDVSNEVTSTQFAVLSAIASTPHIDQNSLSRQVSLDTSTVGDVVNRLLERGYVVRSRDPDDRRRNVLTLTEEGDRLHAVISVAASRMTERLVESLSEQDRDDLVRILQTLVEAGEALRNTAEGGGRR